MEAVKPSPDDLLVAIRAHCLECSGGCRKEVERCRMKNCHLYPYRSVSAIGGAREKKDKRQVSLFDVMEDVKSGE